MSQFVFPENATINEKYVASNRLFPVLYHYPSVLEILGLLRDRAPDEVVRKTVFSTLLNALFLPINDEFLLLRRIYTSKRCRGFLSNLFYLFADIVVLCRQSRGPVVCALNCASDIITELEQTVYCVTDSTGTRRGTICGIVPPPGPGFGIEWVGPAVAKLGGVLEDDQRDRMTSKLGTSLFVACRTVSLVANKYRATVLSATAVGKLVGQSRELPCGSPAPPRKRPLDRQPMRPELLESILE